MTRFTKLEVLSEVLNKGLMPLFYHNQLDEAVKVVKACLQGGVQTVEFTNRGDRAWQVFSALEEKLAAEDVPVMLGVGTVDDAATAAMYINSGANFIVGPTFVEAVARLCNRRKVPYFPGCATVNEIANAEEMGVDVCKVFPGMAPGGPSFLKAVHGPRPRSLLMPTGGVQPTQESINQWVQAGACCVGMGSKLISKDRIANGDYSSITADIEQTLAWIQEARK